MLKSRCAGHADPDTRKLAAELAKKWEGVTGAAEANGAAAPATQQQQPARAGSGVGGGGVGAPRGGSRPFTPEELLAQMELDEEAQRQLAEAEEAARQVCGPVTLPLLPFAALCWPLCSYGPMGPSWLGPQLRQSGCLLSGVTVDREDEC